MKKKPGVMIYFDMRRMVKLLTDEETGKLFEAILDYGETGCAGELTDTLRIVWPLIQQRLDIDSFQYDKKVVKKKYAAYTRWANEQKENVMSYAQWLEAKGYDPEVYLSPAS